MFTYLMFAVSLCSVYIRKDKKTKKTKQVVYLVASLKSVTFISHELS